MMSNKLLTPRRNSPCPCGSGKKYKNCSCSDNERISNHVQGLISRIPPEARVALPYFVNWLLEDLPTLELVAGLSPMAFDILVLQSVHNKCLLELQSRAVKQQETAQGLERERSNLMNRITEINNQQQLLEEQGGVEKLKRFALEPKNTRAELAEAGCLPEEDDEAGRVNEVEVTEEVDGIEGGDENKHVEGDLSVLSPSIATVDSPVEALIDDISDSVET